MLTVSPCKGKKTFCGIELEARDGARADCQSIATLTQMDSMTHIFILIWNIERRDVAQHQIASFKKQVLGKKNIYLSKYKKIP